MLEFKQAVIASILLHIVVLGVLIWNSFNEKSTILTMVDNQPINTITVDNSIELKTYSQRHTEQQKEIISNAKGTKSNEKQNKKQMLKTVKDYFKPQKQIKRFATKTSLNAKAKVNSDIQTNMHIKKTVELAKSTVTKKVVISSKTNRAANNISLDRNVLKKVVHEGKVNNLSSIKRQNISNINVSSTDINNYAEKIKSAIESHFYNTSFYSGKVCTLRINLPPDGGLLLNIKSEGGDRELCEAAFIAARQATIPKPPSKAIYKFFKNSLIDFKP